MFLTKRRILKTIIDESDLLAARITICFIVRMFPTQRFINLFKEVDNWFYDSKERAIMNYSDLSIVKRL